MKKFLYSLGVCCVAVLSIFCFAGCSLKGSDGKDGQDGLNGLTYEDVVKIYDKCVSDGDFTGSFLEFVSQYFAELKEESVANECIRSVVSVSAFASPSSTSYSAGSGVIWKIDANEEYLYVVTNYHVVYADEDVSDYIYLNMYEDVLSDSSNRYGVSCSYIGGSEAYDIAVLKVNGEENVKKFTDNDAKAVSIADYDEYSLGQDVVVIGNPMGEGITVVSGIYSADNKDVDYSISSTQYTHRCFQIDATINSGNSGGGVFNSMGELIGIANAKYMSYLNLDGTIENVEGMSYAIPIQHVSAIADYVIKNCDDFFRTSMSVYKLGIEYVISNTQMQYNTETKKTEVSEVITINSVTASSLASRVGLLAGDVVQNVKVEKSTGRTVEMKITRGYLLKDIVMFMEKGDVVTFTIKRSGETKNLTYTLSSDDSGSLVKLENW